MSAAQRAGSGGFWQRFASCAPFAAEGLVGRAANSRRMQARVRMHVCIAAPASGSGPNPGRLSPSAHLAFPCLMVPGMCARARSETVPLAPPIWRPCRLTRAVEAKDPDRTSVRVANALEQVRWVRPRAGAGAGIRADRGELAAYQKPASAGACHRGASRMHWVPTSPPAVLEAAGTSGAAAADAVHAEWAAPAGCCPLLYQL